MMKVDEGSSLDGLYSLNFNKIIKTVCIIYMYLLLIYR